MKTIRLTFPIVLAAWGATSPALAQDVALDPTLAAGKTIFEHDPSGLGAQAYGALADEFLTRHAAFGPVLAGIAIDQIGYRMAYLMFAVLTLLPILTLLLHRALGAKGGGKPSELG